MHSSDHRAKAPSASVARDTDFHEWAFRQADLLRTRQFDILDVDSLIEEVEDLG